MSLITQVSLPETEQRHWLGDRLNGANSMIDTTSGITPEMVASAQQMAMSVTELPGIELVEEGDFGKDLYNRCDAYVFDTVLGEPWYPPLKHREPQVMRRLGDLWYDPIEFLGAKGIEAIRQGPEPGNIVMYYIGVGWAEHFGIYEGDNSVVSKLARGPVVRHPLELIPAHWGNKCMFFQKRG